VFKSFCR